MKKLPLDPGKYSNYKPTIFLINFQLLFQQLHARAHERTQKRSTGPFSHTHATKSVFFKSEIHRFPAAGTEMASFRTLT